MVPKKKEKKQHIEKTRSCRNTKLCDYWKAWRKICFGGGKTFFSGAQTLMGKEKKRRRKERNRRSHTKASIFSLLIREKGKTQMLDMNAKFFLHAKYLSTNSIFVSLTSLLGRKWKFSARLFNSSLKESSKCWIRKQQQSSTRERRWRISCIFYIIHNSIKIALTCIHRLLKRTMNSLIQNRF